MKKNKKVFTGTAVALSVLLVSAGLSGCSFFSADQAPVESQSVSSSGENEKKTYTVEYYIDENAGDPSDKVTVVEYGKPTPVYTVDELGFSQEGKTFAGWKVHREVDDTWAVRNVSTNERDWIKLTDGKLPEGYEYKLHKDGAHSSRATEEGKILLVGIWEDAK